MGKRGGATVCWVGVTVSGTPEVTETCKVTEAGDRAEEAGVMLEARAGCSYVVAVGLAGEDPVRGAACGDAVRGAPCGDPVTEDGDRAEEVGVTLEARAGCPYVNVVAVGVAVGDAVQGAACGDPVRGAACGDAVTEGGDRAGEAGVMVEARAGCPYVVAIGVAGGDPVF